MSWGVKHYTIYEKKKKQMDMNTKEKYICVLYGLAGKSS